MVNEIKVFEKPVGFRDLLPETVLKKRLIEDKLQNLFSQWGYQEILTPTLEYEETVGKASRITGNRMFKLLDKQGQTLVLRPDMTAPIARVVSSLMQNSPLPKRISYHTNVFRAQENEAGRVAEFFQSGVELIGEGTPDADAEILAIACQTLKKLELGSFKLVVGHVGFINALLEEWISEPDQRDELKLLLANKNIVGFQEMINRTVKSTAGKELLLAISNYQGDAVKLKTLLEGSRAVAVQTALNNLLDIWNLLKIYGLTNNVFFDLALVPHLDYYTGMVFEGIAENSSFPVCSGGRYDTLLDSFNNSNQAIGFALKINRLLDILKQSEFLEKELRIYYDLDHREEALRFAYRKRSEGFEVVQTYRVTVQELNQLQEPNQNVETVYFVSGEGDTFAK